MTIEEQVLAAFQVEHKEYLQQMRQLLPTLSEGSSDERAQRLFEIFRIAHSLKGGARVCNLSRIVTWGHGLETVFDRVRRGELSWDPQVERRVRVVLDGIEDAMASLYESGELGDSEEADAELLRLLDDPQPLPATKEAVRPPEGNRPDPPIPAAPSSPADPPADHDRYPEVARDTANHSTSPSNRGNTYDSQSLETVRLRVDSLDRLLESSGRLVSETMRQERMTRELLEIRNTLTRMTREWNEVRRGAGPQLRHLAQAPELRRVGQYLENLNQHLALVTKKTRDLSVWHRSGEWHLRAFGKRIQEDIRRARIVSAASLFQGFSKMVRDLARHDGKQVDFQFLGADVQADRMVLQSLKDPILHLLRNAVIHGAEMPEERRARGKPETARICLTLRNTGGRLYVDVEDDGRGVDYERVSQVVALRRGGRVPDAEELTPETLTRYLFDPGVSTRGSPDEFAGRGMGLSIVHETVRRLQGNVHLHAETGTGTRIAIQVPVTICSHRLLLVRDDDITWAIPLHAVEHVLSLKAEELRVVGGRSFVMHGDQLVPLTRVAHVAGLRQAPLPPDDEKLHVMIVNSGCRLFAFRVQSFVGERDLFVQPLDSFLADTVYSGAVLLEDGQPALVLHPARFDDHVPPENGGAAENDTGERPAPRPVARVPKILVVDDSFTTRTLEKSLLESQGYGVDVATDGLEALDRLRMTDYDAVISDIEMPRLDGFGLLEEIKKQPRWSQLPVILVTSRDRDEDQRRGLELGADAYIIKRKFDHEDLLQSLQQLV